MKREIKFRGKHFEFGWMIGELMGNEIHVQRSDLQEWWGYPIDEKTLGQYTGLKDLKSTKIYEGDIIDYSGKNCIVTYYDKMMAFGLFFPKEESWLHVWECENNIIDLEVIGNIHDNPELLK